MRDAGDVFFTLVPTGVAPDLLSGEAVNGLGVSELPLATWIYPGAGQRLATTVYHGGSSSSSKKQQVLVIINI